MTATTGTGPRSRADRRLRGRPVVAVATLLGVAALVLSACSSSPATTAASTSTTAPTTRSTPSVGAAAYTITAAHVSGLGTVLVNGDGRTLYLLTGEHGGKLTCTSGSGCLAVWPAVTLPSGVTAAVAGHGVTSSLLGVATGPGGTRVVTYDGWPLYTFVQDGAAGVTKGEGIVSFGGTWYAVSPQGTEVTKVAATGATSTSTTAAKSGGYGY